MNADLGRRWLNRDDAKPYVGRRVKTDDGRTGTVATAWPTTNGQLIRLFVQLDGGTHSFYTDHEHATIIKELGT